MATSYSKPTVRASWGQTAGGADLQDPGNTYASTGWVLGQKPPRQYFNWVLNYLFNGIRYLCQTGIPTYDPTETYVQGAVVNFGNQMWELIAPGPITGVTPVQGGIWSTPQVPNPVNGDNSPRIANTNWISQNYLPVGSTFSAIGGTLSNPQVPVGVVQQWQGSLSLTGSQITTAVSKANTLSFFGAGYATFNWAGQSGQPPWLLGSNDGLNFYVWNPSNFNVANANTVAGLAVTSGVSGNTVVSRDGGGYIYGQNFNQASGNNENPLISQIIVTNGADGFFRKASTAAVAAALGSFTSGNSPFSAAGFQRFLSGGIIQAGRATVNTSATNVSFPLSFPNGCFAVSFTPEGTNNQPFLTNPPNAGFFTAAGGPAAVDYVAFGW